MVGLSSRPFPIFGHSVRRAAIAPMPRGGELFVTPHGQDLAAVAAGFGVASVRITPDHFMAGLAEARSRRGVSVLVLETDLEPVLDAYDRLAGQ